MQHTIPMPEGSGQRPCLRAVLFDMDGVLFDSMPAHAQSWAKVATHFGLIMTPSEAYLHEGRTGEATINILAQRYWGRNATPQEQRDIYALKCEEFNKYPEAPKMPGAEQLLEQVKAMGLTIVVVTGSGQRSLLSRLQTNYPGFFRPDLIVSSADVERGKPAPDPYLMGLEKAGCRPEEAIVVENAPLGVQAARAAGIYTLAANTGPLDPQVLTDAGAQQVFPSMQALADAWSGLFEKASEE